MRRRTILESIHQEAELRLCSFFGESQQLKHLILQFAIMDTDRTSTHFNTIDNHIVSISTYGTRIAIQQRNIFRLRRGERMVHSIETLIFFAPLEQREVNHPQTSKLVLIAQSQLARHFKTQFAELFAGLHRIIA